MRRIVFDFGGVLFRWRPAALLQRLWPARAADADAAAHWAQQVFQGPGGDWAEFDRGAITADEASARICARTGLAAAEMQALIEAVPAELAPIDASVALLERLHATGVPLHYLSNMPAPFARHLAARHAFLARFASGVYSSELLLAKPDRRIYDEAARRFGAGPADLLFLDDHAPNVAAARAAGWQALLFQDAVQAEAAIRQAGWWPAGA